MRELVDQYLTRRLSRRGFIRSMASWGFSVAAATSIVDSLHALVLAESVDRAPTTDRSSVTIVEGTGGELLVAQLVAAGVQCIFNCNSSGTYPIFDALIGRPNLPVINVPQEGQMVSVAQGYTLASGKIAFTINGSVGFPNTLNNMYNAWKDRTAMVIGSQREPAGVHGGRDAFEEWDDYLGPSASFTRWRWNVDQTERIPEITRRAFKIASTPPEGPVALAFPLDVLAATGRKAAVIDHDRFIIAPRVRPAAGLVEEAAGLLVQAQRPILIVGPEVTRSGGHAEVIKLAEVLAIPVTQGERLFDDFPTNHPLFVGDYGERARYPPEIDLVLNVGARMPYQDEIFPRGAKVVHVTIDPSMIGKVVPTDLGIVADVKEAAADLVAAIAAVATNDRLRQMRGARFDQIKSVTDATREQRVQGARARWNDQPLSWERVAGELTALLDQDAIIVPELAQDSWLGGGENAALSQFTFAPGAKRRIGRTTGSALGWGVGAAIGVKLAQPDRQVVALQGDGGFMFGQAESLWTMARYDVPVIVVIFNNRSYNGPRNKILNHGGRQAQAGREMTCYLGDPDVDFARVAAGFGVKGEVVSTPDQIRPAIQRAIDSTRDGRPYLIDAVVGRTGLAADSTWYPKYSVAAARSRSV